MNDQSLTPKPVLPGELFDGDERAATLRELADMEADLAALERAEFNAWVNALEAECAARAAA